MHNGKNGISREPALTHTHTGTHATHTHAHTPVAINKKGSNNDERIVLILDFEKNNKKQKEHQNHPFSSK